MKRWGIGFGIAMLWAILIVLTRSTSSELLKDSDTKVMLMRIEARGNAWSWFAGDWPLENHFYRPVVAETFELDHWLHGWNAPGYGLTNAILCALCVLALFWLLRELTSNAALATIGASLFAGWHLITGPVVLLDCLIYIAMAVAAVAALLSLYSKSRARAPAWAALFGSAMLSREYAGLEPFRGGMIDWVPGRTASTMAVFCLVAMAAYARYERVSAERRLPPPTPLDPPATRGTELLGKVHRPWVWALLAAACTFFALASYEQAVMLPACLLGVAIALKLQHYQVRWGWQAAFWGMLVLYLVLRSQVIPAGTSDYQDQQLRAGPGTFMTLFMYAAPATPDLYRLASGIDLGFINVLIAQPADLAMVLMNLGFLGALALWSRQKFARRDRTLAVILLFGLAASLVAFMPMAWLKPFSYNHYHYWPLALRSAYVTGLIYAVGTWLIAAWSPRGLQAPLRQVPAPGSLPHP